LDEVDIFDEISLLNDVTEIVVGEIPSRIKIIYDNIEQTMNNYVLETTFVID